MVSFHIPLCATRVWSRLFENEYKLFAFLVVFRLVNALIQQTAFVPDEFWQSIEVAHHWVFGYGSFTWEWRPDVALRSPLHPMLIAVVYWLGKLIHMDSALFVLLVPRILHAFLAALADLHLYRLSIQLAGPETAKWVLFHQLANWFTAFCSPRPLANCLEWALTTVALTTYPVWPVVQGQSGLTVTTRPRQFILCALGCVVLRPTAAVIWGPLCLGHLWLVYAQSRGAFGSEKEEKVNKDKMRKLGTFQSVFIEYLIWGIALLLSSVLADRWAYGRWTVNQWNFIRFNLLDGGSHTYGIHPWHWYLSQGLPAMLLTQIPFLFLGIYGDWSAKRRQKQRIPCRLLAFLFVWTTFCYSFLGHKEFRFLFPILPAAMYFCGRGTTIVLKQRSAREKRTLVSSAVILGVLVTQVPVLLYTSLVHQRGTLDAIQFVGRLVEEQHPYEQPNRSSNNMWTPDDWHILCLMPCHSVPSVGFLHKNITIRQLKCDPDLSRWFGEADPHSDEADHFYAHPTAWLWSQLYPIEMSSKSPHVILLFDHLFQTAPQVQHLLLTQWPYRVCGRFFHAHLLTHSRYGHHVLTLCRSDLSAALVIDP